MTPEPFLGDDHVAVADHHILSVLVENKAGVLSRVAGLFSRRGFNINSLAVAPTDQGQRFSRITIVVDAASAPLEQVVRQLDKLVNVVSISHLDPASAVERELLLATIAADTADQKTIVELCAAFSASVVDAGDAEITVMLAGHPDTVDGFEQLLGAHEVTELHRTGMIALPKLTRRSTTTPSATAELT